ncbi:MAG: arylsulfatase [Bacteroidaceae bacterium]
MKHKYSLLSSLLVASVASVAANHQRPNIVLILCDDMGFSDLGCYGSEIGTPHLNSLAERGVRFSQFKNAGRSCPSRASLLTGRYQHSVNMGWMTAVDEHRDGYRGELSNYFPTIAEVLREEGYETDMSGKWHVTVETALEKPDGSYPVERGFNRYYGSLKGGGSYYAPKAVYSNLTPVKSLPKNYYYTTAITDSAVSFIRQHPIHRPLFLYLAHYAPHLPWQGLKERVEACTNRYKVGYDVLRRQRFERLKALGFVDKNKALPMFQKEFGGSRPAWTSLTPQQQEQWITRMANYAAMIETMDDGIGKVMEATKEKGLFDNTIFLFLSDNGATSEGDLLTQLSADLSNTPYRSYKQWCFQGGTSSPLIIAAGNKISGYPRGTICNEPAHIIDLLPTCLEMASVTYPKQFRQHRVKAPDGCSLVPIVQGRKGVKRDLYFEHQTSCAIISGHWKLVRSNAKQPWELIDLSTDPFEEHDLAAQNPTRVKRMEKKWNKWAQRQQVLPFEFRSWSERINYYTRLNL